MNNIDESVRELVVIDGGLDDPDALLAGLPADAAVVVLDPQRDGVLQLAEALAGHGGLAAIHVLSHGAAGSLRLGSAVLDGSTVGGYADGLAAIGQALAEDGDLLLYGCDVASGEEGQAFMRQVAALTGADVAASSDVTGVGGDWRLEAAVGEVEAAELVLAYGGTLGLSVTANTPSRPGRTSGELRNYGAFAVIKEDGSVVTWGNSYQGGDSSAVADKLNGTVDVTQVFSAFSAFAALRADGSVVTWGDSDYHGGGDSSAVAAQLDGTVDVTQVFSNGEAFAALRADGSVVTWGDSYQGGDSSAVAAQIDGTLDVTQVFSTSGAFAALRADGSVVTWGYSDWGGSSSAVAEQLDGHVDITQVFSTDGAFAALRADGSVVTWGYSDWGGDSGTVTAKLDGAIDVTQIFSTTSAFAALRADGSVVTWGDSDRGGDSRAVATKLDGNVDVIQVFSTLWAFAALRADGSVVTWGGYGGDSSTVATELNGSVDVTQVFSTLRAFAALRADGSVVTWGASDNGGDSSTVAAKLDGVIDVIQIFSNDQAFAALRADGSVITWGNSDWGGDSSAVAAQLDGAVDVTHIFSTDYAFAALRSDDSVITWGRSDYGGDSSAVADQLTSGVVSFANILTDDWYVEDPNQAPTLATPLPTQSATEGTHFTYTLPAATFTDPDGDTLTYSATQADGSPLPAWLGFDLATRTISGTVPTDSPDLTLRITATDPGDLSTSGDFTLTTPAAPNQPPTATDQTLTLTEDTPRTLTTADFSFSDTTHTLLAVKVASLPTAGILTLNGAAVTTGQFIGAADLAAGQFAFVPAANAAGSGYASFTFQVQDNGGTADGGVDLDPTPNRLTFNVTPVNDAPAGTDRTIALSQNATHTLTAADFGFSDSNDSPGHALLAVEITTLPSTGTLTLNSVAVTAGQSIGAADLDAGKLLFTPAADGRVDLTFQVQDNGGTANDGVDLDLTPNRLTFDVTPSAKPGVAITPTAGTTSELGGEALFEVRLTTGPSSDVTLTFTSSNPAEGVPTAERLVFGPDNWHQIQTLTIRGVDDNPNDRDDPQTAYQITGEVTSDDIHYVRGIEVPALTLVNLDDPLDKPMVVVGDQDPIDRRDVIRGGHGDDTLSGGYDIDYLYGGRGDDRLSGNDDNDRLYGEEGDDHLNGDNGNDTLDGGAGNDLLSGGNDDDVLLGGEGDDQLNGNDGYDTLDGGAGNDVLDSGAQNDSLQGGEGDDQLYGEGGDDTLAGGAGHDTLDGGVGADHMDGGAGNDVYYIDVAADTVSDSGPASDRDTVIVPATLVYRLGGTLEKATLEGSGNGGLIGNVGRNTLIGNAGHNVLNGGGGNDTFAGGGGNDKLKGGNGVDTADYSDAGKAVNANLTTGKAIGQGKDVLTAIENLFGGKGNDTLIGNQAANVIVGGAGNDTLNGWSGADSLSGGSGADRFVYKAATDTGLGAKARDVIADFSRAQGDKLDLRSLDADPDQVGVQAWTFTGGGFSGVAGQVTFDPASHLVRFDPDGDRQADFEIELTGVSALVTTDFVLG